MIHYVFKVLPKQGGLGGSHHREKHSFSPFLRLEDEFFECEDHVARGNHLSVTTISTRYQPHLDLLDGIADLEEHLFARHLGGTYHQGQTEVEGLRMPDDYGITSWGHSRFVLVADVRVYPQLCHRWLQGVTYKLLILTTQVLVECSVDDAQSTDCAFFCFYESF